MERRSFIKGAIVASAIPAAARADGYDKLNALMQDYEAATLADKEAWGRELEMSKNEAMKAKPPERVQLGRLSYGADVNGERVHAPIYAYFANQIEEYYQENHSRQVMFSPGAIDKVEAETAKRTREQIAELEDIKKTCRKIENACGYTEVSMLANAASRAVQVLEREIINYVPQTLDEAARKARWIVAELDSGRGYLNDREYADLILDALMPIGRATA